MSRVYRTLFVAFPLLAIALVMSLTGSAASSAHQPVLDDFSIRCNESGVLAGAALNLCVPLKDNSGLFYTPPSNGGITVKVTLFLPAGTKITSSKVTWGPAGLILRYKPTYSDLHYKMVADKKGVKRPVWVFHHLEQPYLPIWHFTLKAMPSTAKLCLGAVATPMRLAGAPTQTTKACYSRKV